MRQWSRSRLVLAGRDRGLRARVGQVKKRLCLGNARHMGLGLELDLEPGVWLRSFQLLDTERPSPDPVQEWGEEVEDGVVYGITLRREAVQDPPGPVPAAAQPSRAFVQYRTCRLRRLKAATLNQLITHLLDPARPEPDFARIFLSTYRAFSDTRTLIELLFQRDDMVSELDNSECQKSALMPLIRTWLDEYSEDFWEPPQHRPLRLLSAHLHHRPCFRRLAQRTSALLKKFQSEEYRPAGLITAVQKPAVPGEEEGTREEGPVWETSEELGDFMHFPVRDIAEELTRLDAGLFVKVVPFQCLGCVWSQRDKKESRNLAPSVRATIAQFNAVTNRVITSLLLCHAPPASPPDHRRQPTGPARRARIVERWIGVAQECRQLRNLSSLRAILSALQSNAVYRLKKTWAAVSRECVAIFENLCETFPDENCVLTSREILVEDGNRHTEDSSTPRPPNLCTLPRQMNGAAGVVPYLGTYLTVLTMLDTALPDTVGGGLMNFEKRRREFEILSQIRQLKQACSQYSLPHHPNIAPWLQENRLLTDQESYELSRELEPPVDPCPTSLGIWNHLLSSKKLASFLTSSEGSGRKLHADQISVSSSGSSGSEMEDLASPQSSPFRLKLKSLSRSCQDVAEAFPGSSSSSPAPASETCSSPSCSSSNSQPDLSSSASLCAPSPGACPPGQHQRSVSMVSLPVYNKQVDDSCIVRVSVESSNTGNVYKSILLTSQDKTAQVIQRALEKHSLEGERCQDFTLSQVLSRDRELRIPEKANVFYAMSTSANYDFILRQKWRGNCRPLGSSSSLGSLTGMRHATSGLEDLLHPKRGK
ncbi:ral guanine nucleotide dissociation stimulator-like 1 isoform X1 [Anguilla anguilla]|uniref:ral guanine nucleotide dissociation stimulator-like 1 isoform X1 n=1 Tax=Anguilla anguilla TaxID=7936 RepID=UPI0015A9CC43|nr:ral guanine nucleotide dissociation stimulator-like 1 isoform X1 [Anguilla anguilla]XP_035253649.1 ral guanine nucleotide dissociation stimulator-like 1 isoform X1 [Anguilla anguilla]